MLARLDDNPEFQKMAREYEARAAAEPVIPRDAQIVPDCSPAWHILTVGPAQERTSAAHLSGRRFGVYVPEVEDIAIRRGTKCKTVTPLFHGYVFVYVWDIDRHRDRIMACPGITSIMRRMDGSAVILPDEIIDLVRKAENKERPLTMTIEIVARKKKRRRKSKEVDIQDGDIIGVHNYSPFDRINELDHDERNRVLMSALGLTS